MALGTGEYIILKMKKLVSNKPENFANGREMRNLFETAKQNQADRIAGRLTDGIDITDDELNEITVTDLKW